MIEFELSAFEKWKGYFGKVFLSLLFIISMVLFFVLYPLLSDPNYYKDLILNQAKQNTGLDVHFTDYEPVFFPYPGISFSQVDIAKGDKTILHLESLDLSIEYGVFLGKDLRIHKIRLRDGGAELFRDGKGNFPTLEELSDDSETTPVDKLFFSRVFRNSVSLIELEGIVLTLKDELFKRTILFQIKEGYWRLNEEEREIQISIDGFLNEDPFSLHSAYSFTTDEMQFETLRVEGDLTFQDLHGSDLMDILIIFPNADLRGAKASGKVSFYKREDSKIFAEVIGLQIRDLAAKNGKPFASGEVNTKIWYDIQNKVLGFSNIIVDWKGKGRIYGSGTVGFVPPPGNPLIQFEGSSDYIDLESAAKVVHLWIDPDLERSWLTAGMEDTAYGDRMKVSLNFFLKNARIQDFKTNHLDVSLFYTKSYLLIKRLNVHAFAGHLYSSGSFEWNGKNKLTVNGQLEGIQVQEFTNQMFHITPVNGVAQAKFMLESNGDSLDSLVSHLQINGNVTIVNGQLFSYANILKPISSIGSLINFKKVDFSRSTPFQRIQMGVRFENNLLTINPFLLKADGLESMGGGTISTNRKIDLKFTVALPGVAGKALKLPILYRGTYGVSAPFIDPIWLGSVYAGTLFLANPAGAAVGGIAGSALSEYVDRAVDSVSGSVKSGWGALKSGMLSIFGTSSQENKNQNND